MKYFIKGIFFTMFILSVLLSCDGIKDEAEVDDQRVYYMDPMEEWSLALCTADGQECDRKYIVTFELRGYYMSKKLTPIVMASGHISLGDDIWTYDNCGKGLALPDVLVCWGERDRYPTICTGKVSGDEMSGECTERDARIGTWKAQKGIVDVENGSFEKDMATGKTRLYFHAWAENASRVYITADFINGQVELAKCDEIGLYDWNYVPTAPEYIRHIIDVWKISSSPTCSSEDFYEFPSTTTPLVVKTHIVKTSGEIVREKTITEGIEVNGN